MNPFWKGKSSRPTRHGEPDEAVARYLEQLHQADVAGAPPPPAALYGLGDAYLDKEDPQAAADYWRQAAEAYAREGMHANSVACLKKIRRHSADEGDVGLLLGRAYAAKGLAADALAELDRYTERRGRSGSRRDTIEALKEIVRLAPQRAERHEELAGLLLEDGQREAALAAYGAARTAYETKGDRESARRLTGRIEQLEGGPAATPPAPDTVAPPPLQAPEPEPPPKPPASDVPTPLDLLTTGPLDEPIDVPGDEADGPLHSMMDLEIERTSYSHPIEPPEDDPMAGAPDGAPLTVEQESVPPEEVAPVDLEIELDDLSEAASLRDAMEELERTEPGRPAAAPPPTPPAPPAPAPGGFGELADLARRQSQEGDRDQAARNLLVAAEGLRGEERWPEAVRAYRALAEIGAAKDEDFDDWAECARQTGRASEVLEALAVAARSRLARNDRLGARRAAEEMLLVDPHNAVASEILERAGVALPPE